MRTLDETFDETYEETYEVRSGVLRHRVLGLKPVSRWW